MDSKKKKKKKEKKKEEEEEAIVSLSLLSVYYEFLFFLGQLFLKFFDSSSYI
jgi:hypothetical protein